MYTKLAHLPRFAHANMTSEIAGLVSTITFFAMEVFLILTHRPWIWCRQKILRWDVKSSTITAWPMQICVLLWKGSIWYGYRFAVWNATTFAKKKNYFTLKRRQSRFLIEFKTSCLLRLAWFLSVSSAWCFALVRFSIFSNSGTRRGRTRHNNKPRYTQRSQGQRFHIKSSLLENSIRYAGTNYAAWPITRALLKAGKIIIWGPFPG